MATQSESLGPAIALKPGYETYWAYIGHFIHSPFYVYAYAFGDCLVNSLYGVYERSSEGFAERYLAMLAAGGSKSYSELLEPFGLDAKDPGFWTIGLSVIGRMIDELEATSVSGLRLAFGAVQPSGERSFGRTTQAPPGSRTRVVVRIPKGSGVIPRIQRSMRSTAMSMNAAFARSSPVGK